jgi:hypothetical protein
LKSIKIQDGGSIQDGGENTSSVLKLPNSRFQKKENFFLMYFFNKSTTFIDFFFQKFQNIA